MSSSPPPSADRPVRRPRVTVAQRERAEAHLREAASHGLLTLEEYGDRVQLVLAATSREELAEATADLDLSVADPGTPAGPGPDRGPRPAERAGRRRSQNRLLVAIMGGHEERGRWRPAPNTTALAVMGGVEADLREAEVDGDELTMTAIAIMGAVEITVPEGVEVELGGFAFMGANENRVRQRDLHPAAPLVRINAWSLMGGVEVKTGPRTGEGVPLRAGSEDRPVRAHGGARRMPAPAPAPAPPARRRGGLAGWVVAGALALALVFGLNPGLPAQDGFALFGSDVVNLSAVEEDREVSVFAAFGSIEIIVPPEAQVELDGVTIFGSRECQPCEGAPGDPVIRIRGTTGFGSIEVREAGTS